MAIVFRNNKYNIKIDSQMIIGVLGRYDKLFSSLIGDNVYYIDKRFSVSNKKVLSLFDIDNESIIKLLKEFDLSHDYLNKRINELSHSEQKLLKYLLMIRSNSKIIIIDEPFMDLDYGNKKKIILLLNQLLKEKKTVIIGSINSNIIYSICKSRAAINYI